MALGDPDLVQAVLDDWRTAPIPEGLRATLGFLEKLTLTPAAVGPPDIAAVRAAGVSDEAIEDAIYVCTMFSIIVRMADTLNFYLPDEKGYAQDAASLLKRGYKL